MKKLLGTAKTLFKNKYFFKDDFLLIHGDNYCEEGYKKINSKLIKKDQKSV